MTTNLRTLFCVVDGEDTPFSVKISSTDTVDDLKNLIVNGNQGPAFREVATKDLILWRVSIPVNAKGNAIILDNVAEIDKEKMAPTDDVGEVFKETPPKKTIHIIIQVPQRGNECFAFVCMF
jgi:hypothetical protein